MSCFAERDQVIFHVTTRLAPKFLMMHFELFHGSAELTSPAILSSSSESESADPGAALTRANQRRCGTEVWRRISKSSDNPNVGEVEDRPPSEVDEVHHVPVTQNVGEIARGSAQCTPEAQN